MKSLLFAALLAVVVLGGTATPGVSNGAPGDELIVSATQSAVGSLADVKLQAQLKIDQTTSGICPLRHFGFWEVTEAPIRLASAIVNLFQLDPKLFSHADEAIAFERSELFHVKHEPAPRHQKEPKRLMSTHSRVDSHPPNLSPMLC